MNQTFTIFTRALFTFVAMMVIQYKIIYPVLAVGGLIAGFFVLKTSSDRALGIGIIIGSVLFGIYAALMHYLGYSQL